MQKYEALKDENDSVILASRGIKALTSEEKSFYNTLIDNSKNELTNFEVALPKTTENKIFEDIERDHPVLAAIDFVNSKGLLHLARLNFLNTSCLAGFQFLRQC